MLAGSLPRLGFAFTAFLILFTVSCGTIPVPGRSVDAGTGKQSSIKISSVKQSSIKQSDIDHDLKPQFTTYRVSRNKDTNHRQVVNDHDKIPAIKRAPADHRPEKSAKIHGGQTLPAEVIDAKQSIASGKYQQAIDLLEIVARENRHRQDFRDLLFDSYMNQIARLQQLSDHKGVTNLIDKALKLKPQDTELSQHVKINEKLQKTSRLYELGVTAMKQGKPERAITLLHKALLIDPKHKHANEKISLLKHRYLDEYHKQAMVLFRQQELDRAIDIWGRVLILEPGHEMARLYLDRAVALKSKFDKL